jgi:hypothetical protein
MLSFMPARYKVASVGLDDSTCAFEGATFVGADALQPTINNAAAPNILARCNITNFIPLSHHTRLESRSSGTVYSASPGIDTPSDRPVRHRPNSRRESQQRSFGCRC